MEPPSSSTYFNLTDYSPFYVHQQPFISNVPNNNFNYPSLNVFHQPNFGIPTAHIHAQIEKNKQIANILSPIKKYQENIAKSSAKSRHPSKIRRKFSLLHSSLNANGGNIYLNKDPPTERNCLGSDENNQSKGEWILPWQQFPPKTS